MNQVYRIPVMELIHRDKFSDKEWSKLENCVRTVRNYDSARMNYEGATIAAGRALIQIRDEKLYRGYPTLKSFCQSVFGWSDRRTQQLIKSSKVVAALPEKSEPMVRNERQARELSQVPPEKRVEVLERAQKDGQITAKSISQAASKISEKQGRSVEPVDILGRIIPKAALKYWNRKAEAKTVLSQISAARGQVEHLDPKDPMWGGININGVMSDLNAAYNRFAASVPAYVCPYCDGVKPEHCKTCKGRGVISKYFWKLIPESVRKKHERT